MQKIDHSTWPRAEKFGFFSAVSQPFYSVTFRVDVTNLHAYTKQRGLSFYYALVYLATNAVNAVENFRYTIRDGEVYLLDERIPSFTDLKPGSEDFHIVTLPQEETLEQFCAAAKARSEAQAHFLDQDDKELDALIYFSCTPWFDLTALTNERDFDRDDNIPRIAWGEVYAGRHRPRNAGDVGGSQPPLPRRYPPRQILPDASGVHRRAGARSPCCVTTSSATPVPLPAR